MRDESDMARTDWRRESWSAAPASISGFVPIIAGVELSRNGFEMPRRRPLDFSEPADMPSESALLGDDLSHEPDQFIQLGGIDAQIIGLMSFGGSGLRLAGLQAAAVAGCSADRGLPGDGVTDGVDRRAAAHHRQQLFLRPGPAPRRAPPAPLPMYHPRLSVSSSAETASTPRKRASETGADKRYFPAAQRIEHILHFVGKLGDAGKLHHPRRSLDGVGRTEQAVQQLGIAGRVLQVEQTFAYPGAMFTRLFDETCQKFGVIECHGYPFF